jgi:hypothetical protein
MDKPCRKGEEELSRRSRVVSVDRLMSFLFWGLGIAHLNPFENNLRPNQDYESNPDRWITSIIHMYRSAKARDNNLLVVVPRCSSGVTKGEGEPICVQ